MSGSLAIISKSVGLDRVLSGGGDIGFRSPAVKAELNLLKLEGNAESDACPVGGGVPACVKSMTGDRLPGENRILNVDGESGIIVGSGSLITLRTGLCRGGGGGGGGEGMGLDAGQHQELSGETIVAGSSFRL